MYDIDNIIDVVCEFIQNILNRLGYEDANLLLTELLTFVDDKQQELDEAIDDFLGDVDESEYTDEDTSEELATQLDTNEAELKKKLRNAWMEQHKDLMTSQTK